MMLGPQLLEAGQPVRIVLHRVAFTVTFPAIEGNQRRQGKRQTRRELTAGLLPCQKLRQNTGAVLGHAVERNRQQLMFDIRVAETARYRTGEGGQLITRQIQYRDNLFMNGFFNKGADFRVVHRLADGIQPGLKRHRHQSGMCAVEDRHLALFVRLDVIHNQHVQRQLVETQLLRQRFWPLDHKQIEVFGGIKEGIVIAKRSFELGDFVTWITGHDTVNQRRAEGIGIVQPLGKGRWQRPLLGIAQYQFTQGIAVIVNQFTRYDHPAFIRCAVEMAETLEQQTSQFRRIADRWRILKLIPGVIADPRLRGVGEDKAHVRVVGQFQEFVVLIVNADFAVHRADQARVADRFALLIQATDDGGIEAVLGTE